MQDAHAKAIPNAADFFARHPATKCPECEYALAGLTQWRCPECGTHLAPGQILEEGMRTPPAYNPQLRWDHAWFIGTGFWLAMLFVGVYAADDKLEQTDAIKYMVRSIAMLGTPVTLLAIGVSKLVREQRDGWRTLGVLACVLPPAVMLIAGWLTDIIFSL